MKNGKQLLVLIMVVLLSAFGCARNADAQEKQFMDLSFTKVKMVDGSVIQIALLLDTSNSMDGLINQAKGNLWTIINSFSAAKKGNGEIKLEIALYEYGNDSLSEEKGYIREVLAFSSDLDLISQKLFNLTTNGGTEFCGTVINRSIDNLDWVKGNKGLKLVYIAGNEPFTQGKISYKAACKKALKKNIIINTIHCGNYDIGISEEWQNGAKIGGGCYIAIDHNLSVSAITTPFDDRIFLLNSQLNSTYIGFGRQRKEKKEMQMRQDSNASGMNAKVMVDRAISKSSKNYSNSGWDLVDAYNEDEEILDKIEEKELPKELKGLSDKEILTKLKLEKEKRDTIASEIQKLSQKRLSFIKESQKNSNKGNTLDSSIIETVKLIGTSAGFSFK